MNEYRAVHFQEDGVSLIEFVDFPYCWQFSFRIAEQVVREMVAADLAIRSDGATTPLMNRMKPQHEAWWIAGMNESRIEIEGFGTVILRDAPVRVAHVPNEAGGYDAQSLCLCCGANRGRACGM